MKPVSENTTGHYSVSRTATVVGLYLFFVLFWICERELKLWNSDIYTYVYFLLPLYGGYVGLQTAKLWGGSKSAVGKAILGFASGLLLQVFGQLSYAYYLLFMGQDVPYPSIGDVGFFGSIFCYIYAVYQLAQASGSRFSLKSISYKLISLFLPFVLLAISYVVFINGQVLDTTNLLKLILDLGYPLGQSIYISLALLALILSGKYLGGMLKTAVLIILFGLITQYIADFMFLYEASRGIWEAGQINDLVFLTAYFLTSLGITRFYIAFNEIENNSK
jgi:hypothetical protein